MLLGENILTLSLYLYRKKTYSSNLLLLKYDTDMKREPVYIFILKLFFFPNYLGKLDGDSAKEEHVSGELINRAITP